MPNFVLVADPKKCNGCGLCQMVCAMVKEGIASPEYARIHIIRFGANGFFLPIFCQNCEDAPCMAVCPQEAIAMDKGLTRVRVDYNRCISCQMCMAACPFGAIRFDRQRHTVFKCDLCGGDPQCVNYCFPNALAYIPAYQQHDAQARAAATVRRHNFLKNHQVANGNSL